MNLLSPNDLNLNSHTLLLKKYEVCMEKWYKKFML